MSTGQENSPAVHPYDRVSRANKELRFIAEAIFRVFSGESQYIRGEAEGATTLLQGICDQLDLAEADISSMIYPGEAQGSGSRVLSFPGGGGTNG